MTEKKSQVQIIKEDLQKLAEDPAAEISQSTKTYLAWREGGKEGLSAFIRETEAEAQARRQELLKKYEAMFPGVHKWIPRSQRTSPQGEAPENE